MTEPLDVDDSYERPPAVFADLDYRRLGFTIVCSVLFCNVLLLTLAWALGAFE